MEMEKTLAEEVRQEYAEIFRAYHHSLILRKVFESVVTEIRLANPQENGLRLYAEELLCRIVTGETNFSPHFNPQDFQILARALSAAIKRNRLTLKTFFCPAYGGYLDNDEWVYDLKTLTGDPPWTAINAHDFLIFTSQFSQRHRAPIDVLTYFPAWELTRFPVLDLNGGLTPEEALELLRQSAQATRKFYQRLTDQFLQIKVATIKPDNFQSKVVKRETELLQSQRKALTKLATVRQKLYGNKKEEERLALAARDLAEAQIGWEALDDGGGPFIIAVFTSPKIAHFALSGKNQPWFQQRPRYKG